MCFDANAAKEEKLKKRSDIFKESMTNYDIPPQCVCAITSFEGFVQNQPVFHSIMCLVLGSKALLFSWLAKFFIKT